MPLYALIGLLATAVHYLVLTMLVEVVGIEPGNAAALGATAGALAAYAGNRRFTFESRAAHGRTLPRFLLVAAFGAATSAAAVFAGTEWLGLHYLLPQAAATALVFATGFTLNRHWTFA